MAINLKKMSKSETSEVSDASEVSEAWSGAWSGACGGAWGGVVSGGDLSPPLWSRAFSAERLARCFAELKDDISPAILSRDMCGELPDAARLALRAPLAPHHRAATLLLSAAAEPAAGFRLRLTTPVRTGDAMALWFDDDILARLHMPYLTLQHIRGRNEYVCDVCSRTFEEPNPLKLHLLLECRPFSHRAFWQMALRRLESSGSGAWAGRALEAAAAAAEAWAAAAGGSTHACVYCGKLYSRRYGLKIHIRTHTGYKPLRCAICARAFADPSNLNKHARLHATTRPSTRLKAIH